MLGDILHDLTRQGVDSISELCCFSVPYPLECSSTTKSYSGDCVHGTKKPPAKSNGVQKDVRRDLLSFPRVPAGKVS